MAKKHADDEPKATSDAYTGMLSISLLALIAGCVLLFLDYSQYPEKEPPPVPKGPPAAQAAPPAAAPANPAPAAPAAPVNPPPPADPKAAPPDPKMP